MTNLLSSTLSKWNLTMNLKTIASIWILFVSCVVNAVEIPNPTLPDSITAPISVGQQTLSFEVNLTDPEALFIEAIVPVDGVEMTLFKASGTRILDRVQAADYFNSGNSQGLPGGQFILTLAKDQLAGSGEYQLQFTFPAAPTQTAALVTVLAQESEPLLFSLSSYEAYTQTPISVGLSVGPDTESVTPASPIAEIYNEALTKVGQFPLEDNGQGADGVQGDNVFSAVYSFEQAGRYTVQTEVSYTRNGVPYSKTVGREIEVFASPAQLNSVEFDLQTQYQNGNQCVVTINQRNEVNITTPGTYLYRTTLSNENGDEISKHVRIEHANQGITEVNTVSFTSDEIRAKLGSVNSFLVSNVELVYLDDYSPGPISQLNLGAVEELQNIEQICQPPIVIGNSLSVTTTERDNYIDTINVSVPVNVTRAGSYQVSFKAVTPQGETLIEVAQSLSFNLGDNQVPFSISASQLQQIDGAIEVIGAIVVGQGYTANRAIVGSLSSFSKYQMYPTKPGDLNGDNSVTPADRDELAKYRNQPALSPGDRRDLNRDGRIDIRDIGLISRLR